jgi:hypothetical protein
LRASLQKALHACPAILLAVKSRERARYFLLSAKNTFKELLQRYISFIGDQPPGCIYTVGFHDFSEFTLYLFLLLSFVQEDEFHHVLRRILTLPWRPQISDV